MSSKAKRMSADIKKEEVPTVVYQYRIDVELAGVGPKTTYMVVSGVPSDLPEEMEPSVKAAAEKQFASVIKQSAGYLEFYDLGKTNSDDNPTFYNLMKMDWIKVTSITKVN